jgi:hypothetical protein
MQIGFAHAVERCRRFRLAFVPGLRERLLEADEALLGDIGDQFVAIAIMTIRRRGTDAGQLM